MQIAIAPAALLTSPAAPLPEAGRVQLLDTLRALALFGVIVMNVTSMVMAYRAEAVMADPGVFDNITALFDLVFLQGKARSCFALLFGVGFGVMLMRAQAAGHGFGGFYLRRMLGLLAFGVFNQVFLFWGDILAIYALLGTGLLLFRSWSDRALLVAAAILVVAVPLLHGLYEGVSGAIPGIAGASTEEVQRQAAQGLAVYRDAAYGPAVFAQNLRWLATSWGNNTAYKVVYVLGVLGLFLLGMLTARRGWLFDVEAHRALLRRLAWWLLPVGLALSVLHATVAIGIEFPRPMAGVVTASYMGLPLLAIGYMAGLGLWFTRHGAELQQALAPSGRMALTNYLASGAIGSLVLHGYGLGLIESLGMAQLNLLGIAVFAVLALVSHAWLRRFRHGPMEWLWRCISHGALQPLRRAGVSDRASSAPSRNR